MHNGKIILMLWFVLSIFCLGSWLHYPESKALAYGNKYTSRINDSDRAEAFLLSDPYVADVNNDCVVDIYDVVLVCSFYGSTSSDPNWNSRYDLALPYEVIDLFDIEVVLASYGSFIESMGLRSISVWIDDLDQSSEAALLIENKGALNIVVGKINVRGQECYWSKIYFNITDDSIPELDYVHITTLDTLSIAINGEQYTLQQTSDNITVQPGYTAIVYIKNPDHISINDVGITVGTTVFTSFAMYYKECTVRVGCAVPEEEWIIIDFYFRAGTIQVVVENTGMWPVTITLVFVNDNGQSMLVTIDGNSQLTLNLTYSWSAGHKYQIKLVSSRGDMFTSMVKTAPNQ